MFPFSQGEPEPGAPNLEDRLRGLILSNANADTAQPPSSAQQPHAHSLKAHQAHQVSPHIPNAPPSGQDYVAREGLNLHDQNNSNQPAHLSGRNKRPNQAQRRQMNTQMSIPNDSRPDFHHDRQAGRGRGSFDGPRYSQNRPNQQGFHSQERQQQNHHSPFASNSHRPPHHLHRSDASNAPQSSLNTPHQGSRPDSSFRQGFVGSHSRFQAPSDSSRPPLQNRQLFQPGFHGNRGRGRQFEHNQDDIPAQSSFLETLLRETVPSIGIDSVEEAEKEAFRATIEQICQNAITRFEQVELKNQSFIASTVELQCFGSLKSGFATKASDMDLALLTPFSEPAPDSSESRIPRLLEQELLSFGYGARLLTRTRVPIIKLCEKPTQKLLSDLRVERSKWDNGMVVDAHHEEDDDHEAGGMTQPEKMEHQDSAEKRHPSANSGTHIASPSDSYEAKLSLMMQKEKQSLGDYYSIAKRVLRNLGSRDITASSPALEPQQSKILNDVCRAFISGIASKELSDRLQGYSTIQPLFTASLPFLQRSIHGVWLQMEGERLAMAWDSRQVTESNDKLELEALNDVEQWRLVQDKVGVAADPVFYNRQLFSASEKLKKISSLQIEFWEQLPHENPVFYHARSERLLSSLKGRNSSNPADVTTPIVINKYVDGITDQQIKQRLRDNYRGNNLREVAQEHRRFQLAVDYEHAVEIKLFKEADVSAVKKYIAMLWNDSPTDLANGSQSALVSKIRSLPDPTLVSPLRARDRYKDNLEFPKDIGIQCDINFSAHLAIHNTLLLRCYSLSDTRVKPMILFIKTWAKTRGINTPYRGSLSSYGYVLMVLHYLVNIAQPFVCPNLQLVNKDPPPHLSQAEIDARTVCDGRNVQFWRNEYEIKNLADRKMLNHNHDSLGLLLRGFFEYYAQNGLMTTYQGRCFDWGRDSLSLRTPGGLLTKQAKGWVGAKTVIETTTIAAPPSPKHAKDAAGEPASSESGATKPVKTIEEKKEIRHRYLFAIEDPFELDHNVARTVTHNGIVSIRDEFRRAWRIIRVVGKTESRESLLDPVSSETENQGGLKELLDLLHGPEVDDAAVPVPVPERGGGQ